VPLLLAAGEVDVEGTGQETLVEPDPAGLGDHALTDLALGPTSGGERLDEHVLEAHPGHLGRVLHREVEAGAGPLPRRQGEEVLAVAGHGPAEDLVAGPAGDDVGEGRLAGPVGTHDRVDLAAADDEVDPVEDLLAGDGGSQAFDAQLAHWTS